MRVIKCLMVGDPGVGKTSLMTKVSLGITPSRVYTPTIGYVKYEVDVDGVVFVVFDCSGQNGLTPIASIGSDADCAIVVYDTSRPATLYSAIHTWIPAILSVTDPTVPIPILLCGTKMDIKSTPLGVTAPRESCGVVEVSVFSPSGRSGFSGCFLPFKYLALEFGLDDIRDDSSEG